MTARSPAGRRTNGFFDAALRRRACALCPVARRFAERAVQRHGAGRRRPDARGPARACARDHPQRAAVVGRGLLMSALAILAVRSALRPLRRIEEGLVGRTPRDLTPIDVTVPREIGGLVGAINRFMARLDRQVTAMQEPDRRRLAPVAHPGRGDPGTGRARRRRNRPRAAAPDRRAHPPRGQSRATDRPDAQPRLIIHRADAVPPERVDLRACRDPGGRGQRPRLLAATGASRLDLPEEAGLVRGDALSLVEACKNLVGNALRHGAPPVTRAVRGRPGARVARRAGAGTGPARRRTGPTRPRGMPGHSGVSRKAPGSAWRSCMRWPRAHGGTLAFPAPAGGFEASIWGRPAGGAAS